MTHRSILCAAIILFSLSACGDKAQSDSTKAMEHFMSEQEKLLEQAKEVGRAAAEVLEQKKKELEEMKDK